MKLLDVLIAMAVAGVVLVTTYLALHWTAGRQVYAAQDPVATQSLEDLIQLAHDNKSEDQLAAILKLGEDRDNLPFTVPLLAELTIHPRSAVREAASHSLTQIGQAGIPHLKSLFNSQVQMNEYGQPANMRQIRADRAMACAAIQAIGDGCDVYLPELEQLIQSEDSGLRKCALFALQGMGEDAQPLLDGVIACLHDTDFNNQCSACRVIESLGPSAARAEADLLKILDKGNPSVRGWAAICLGSIGKSASTRDNASKIAEKMKKASPVEMERMLKGLAGMGSDADHVTDAVREQLSNWDRYVEAHAAIALWKIQGEEDLAMQVIGKMLTSSGYEQDGLGIIISQMGPDAAPLLPSVRALAHSNEPITRELCAAALGSMGPKAQAATGDLQTMLGDEDVLVRYAAKQALRRVRPESQTGQ